MPKLPRITAKDAEKLLLNADFIEMRSKGSHRIYFRGNVRVVIPFHSGKVLHPKTVQQVFTAIESLAFSCSKGNFYCSLSWTE